MNSSLLKNMNPFNNATTRWTWLAIIVSLFPGIAYSANRPNIVLVFIDDMGWGDFSCFGNEDAQTPNIDRLASEGIRFEQFYVNSPICSPSRTAISTGQLNVSPWLPEYIASSPSRVAVAPQPPICGSTMVKRRPVSG